MSTSTSFDNILDEMSSENVTAGEESERSGAMFHIYILSFSYGFLLVI